MTHDADFPFLVLHGERAVGKFADRDEAEVFAERIGGTVIETTNAE